MLVSVLPLMTVKGTKQIHISSPGAPNSWISQVGDVKREDGSTLAQVIDCKYRCRAHAQIGDKSQAFSCVCNDIFRPDHIKIETGVESLMNLVSEGSFETELTGGHVDVVRPDNYPFQVRDTCVMSKPRAVPKCLCVSL
ncbi:truncated terminase [Anguillid herpesvirus 1]|nr:truncated terminase [Anguillid herpesvirus 1]